MFLTRKCGHSLIRNPQDDQIGQMIFDFRRANRFKISLAF